MKLLLDTHTFLWFITGNPKLTAVARTLIEDMNNERLLSVASLWEMAIKVSIGKLNLVEPFDVLIPNQMQINAVAVLDIKPAHVVGVVAMPFHHKDPFDRLLAAQCQAESLPLVSADAVFDKYSVQRLW